jgi:hypothetical protein
MVPPQTDRPAPGRPAASGFSAHRDNSNCPSYNLKTLMMVPPQPKAYGGKGPPARPWPVDPPAGPRNQQITVKMTQIRHGVIQTDRPAGSFFGPP